MKVNTQSTQFLTLRAFQYTQANSSSAWEGDQVEFSTEAHDLSNHRYNTPELQEQLRRPEPDQKWCPAAPGPLGGFGEMMSRFLESILGALQGFFGSLFGDGGSGASPTSLGFSPTGPAAEGSPSAGAPSSSASPPTVSPSDDAPLGPQPGGALSDRVMSQAQRLGDEINAGGGYQFDGVNDCYGMVNRTWDPILQQLGMDPLPRDDGPNSPDWGRIDDWSDLRPGDVLSTAQGHQWGGQWHGGLYAGMDENGNHLIYDNSSSQGGARLRALPSADFFTHFYRPTHDLLTA